MSCKDVRRIRLDLSEVLNEKPRVWFLINPKPYDAETVKHLKSRLAEKFHFQNGLNFSLHLDEFEVPEDESVLIFRDDDLVVVKQVADVSSRSSVSCAVESREVAAVPSSSTIDTEPKIRKRKRKPEDGDEIDSETVRRKRIDSEEVNQHQSCSPSPEPEVAACSDAEQPSSPVQSTAVPKKKKHKTNKKEKEKKKKKKKDKKSKDEEVEAEIDEDEHESDPDPVVEKLTVEAEESPKTPTPKKKRRRRPRKNTPKDKSTEDAEENIPDTSPNGHRIVAPLNTGRWQPIGNHLRFDDEGVLNAQNVVQPEDVVEQQQEDVSAQQKKPVVIQRRKKGCPKDLPEEKQPEMHEKDCVREPSRTVAPKADYAACSALEGPPRVGDIIAYKELELSATYCPEVSEYKEGVVTRYDSASKTVTVEFLQPIVRKVATGRFELRTPPPLDEYGEYVETEEEETVTVTEGTIALDSMIEPKLISVPCSQRSPAY